MKMASPFGAKIDPESRKEQKLKIALSIEVSGNRERPLWGNRERPQNTLKHDAHLLKMKMKWYFSTRIYQK